MQTLLLDFISQYVTLTKEEERTLTELDIFHFVKKGTVLLAEGQTSRNGYFVLKGCVRTYHVVDGEEKTTEFYTEMQGVMPACVLTKEPSAYYIATCEDCMLTISDPSLEADTLEKFPKFEAMCRALSQEIILQQTTEFGAFRTSSPEQRYLHLLKARPNLVQRVPQHQLASYLGMKPQSLSRLRGRILENSRS